MFMSGPGRLLRDAVTEDFAACDGLVVDLRGRGGSTLTVTSLLAVVQWANREWGRPIVFLIDHGTRSAKEVFAHEVKRQGLGTLIGQTTAGAVVPATFESVGHGMVLMYPAFSLGRYTRILEGRGVVPDVEIEDAGPYSAGRDPILDAALLALAPPSRRAI
jgi:C-terminal processing protease CtpA/Prc